MPERFGNTVEEETHGHSSGKKHRKVLGVGELGFGVLRTQLDVTEPVGHVEHEEEPDGTGTDVEPGKVLSRRSAPRDELLTGVDVVNHAPGGDSP